MDLSKPMRALASRAGGPASNESRGGVQLRPRILYYCHDGLGLGHLRLTIAIATGMAERRPDAAQVAFTSLLQAQTFAVPATLDFIKLPSITKEQLYEFETARSSGRIASRDVHTVREAIIAATVDTFAPDLILVDHEPGGLAGELVPLLNRLAAAGSSRPRLVVGLRDITYGPDQTQKEWREDGLYDLLDRVFDRILVYGSRGVFDPIQEYAFSSVAASKTTFTGYIKRPEPVRSAKCIRKQLNAESSPLVVVTVGGGSDGANLIRTYLEAVGERLLSDVVSYLVTGPQCPVPVQAELTEAAADLPGLHLVPFCDDVVSYLHAADVVVTMGGYNALCEAISAHKRPLVVPRKDDLQEQMVRAKRFHELGLIRYLPSRHLTAGKLGAMVRDELDSGFSPVPTLDFGGLERIADSLLGELH